MADRYTTVFGDQIDVTALGLGLKKDANDNLEVSVDDVTIEIAGTTGSEGLQVKDAGITEDKIATSAVTESKIADEAVTEAKLDALDTPNDGEFLAWNETSQQFEWIEIDIADAVLESDVICNEIPSGLINSLNVTFTLANTPVAGTVEVYLNGMFQAPGVGLDYTISGNTITFVKAPRTNSVLYASYIIDN
jgi:hypothetical protein